MSEKMEKTTAKPEAQYLKITFVGTGASGTETPAGIGLECVGLTKRQIMLAAVSLFETVCAQFRETEDAPKENPLTKFLINSLDLSDKAMEVLKEMKKED